MPSPILSPSEKAALLKKFPPLDRGAMQQVGADRLALKALLMHVYDQFVSDTAPMQINVKAANRQAVSGKVQQSGDTKAVWIRQGGLRHLSQTDSLSTALFAPAVTEIMELMRKDTWKRCVLWMKAEDKKQSSISSTAMNADIATDCEKEIRVLESYGIKFG